MGLVKYALGSYGEDIVSLAAQDYFFEGNRWRKAYFENLTNLVPMSRNGLAAAGAAPGRRAPRAGQDGAHLPRGHAQPPTARSTSSSRCSATSRCTTASTSCRCTWAARARRCRRARRSLHRRDVEARIGPPLEVAELGA